MDDNQRFPPPAKRQKTKVQFPDSNIAKSFQSKQVVKDSITSPFFIMTEESNQHDHELLAVGNAHITRQHK